MTGRIRILGQDMTLQLAICTAKSALILRRTTLCFPGTNRLKKAVLGDHEKSIKHKEAISENSMKNSLPQHMLRQVARTDESLGNIFRSVLWLAVRGGHCAI